jgi:hypothetical protein
MIVTKYTRLYRIFLWLLSEPLIWIFIGFVLATFSNMTVVVNALNAIDKVLVCK